MNKKTLKTALVGVDETGAALLEAASKNKYFSITAVADKDIQKALSLGEKYSCTSYDDYRQMIIQNQFDCMIVCEKIYNCHEYLCNAIKKGVHILKTSPAARNFEETYQFCRLAAEANIKFGIFNSGRFAKSYLALRQYIEKKPLEQFSLITAYYAGGEEGYPVWQTDRKLSGGGVLLQSCYGIIDQIIWNFSAPQQIYSLNTNTAGDRQQRLYLTEDTVLMAIKYSDSTFGQVIAIRTAGPKSEYIKIYGKTEIVTVDNEKFTVSDMDGKVKHLIPGKDSKLSQAEQAIENFALSILQPEQNRLISSIKENLKNMAVIEAAYLSARTCSAEEPERILGMVKE